MPRTAVVATRALVVLLVPLLGFAWLAAEKTVTLRVDGETTHVRTHAGTVGELLARAGVEVEPGDRLVPAATTRLSDGMLVELARGRDITVLIGDAGQHVVTTAMTVDAVLAQVSARLAGPTADALVRPSRLAPVWDGMVVEVAMPVAVAVLADGRRHEVITDADTVGEVLRRLGITVDGDDRVWPEHHAAPRSGVDIVVQRVAVTEEARQEAVPHGHEERPSADLPAGERRELQPGRDGVREVVERVVRVDGVEESRSVVTTRTLREPEPRVVAVGTAPRDPPAARSEPRPAAPSAPPPPPPAPVNAAEGQASWYDHPHGGLTAAHRTLPFGTVVTVTNLADGRSVQVTVNDRGPYVAGRVIDLSRAAFARIAAPSAGVISVRITW